MLYTNNVVSIHFIKKHIAFYCLLLRFTEESIYDNLIYGACAIFYCSGGVRRLKKGDLIWVSVLAAFVAVLLIPASREAFISFTSTYVYLGAFLKFVLLATMGELLGGRIVTGNWSNPPALILRALIWGFFGMAIALVFKIYNAGAIAAIESGLLPGGSSEGFSKTLLTAFFTSFTMNVTFAPILFAVHKITDTTLDLKFGEKLKKVNLDLVLSRIDWKSLVKVTWLRYCLFFWVPMHTLVFLIPSAYSDYRVLASAFLSIVMGVIGAITKKSGPSPSHASSPATVPVYN